MAFDDLLMKICLDDNWLLKHEHHVGSESPQRREGVATSGVALKTEVQEKEQVKVKRRELHKKEGTVA